MSFKSNPKFTEENDLLWARHDITRFDMCRVSFKVEFELYQLIVFEYVSKHIETHS